jgi:ubiquitin-protein ligase
MKQSQNRIKKELQEVRKDSNSGVTVEVDETAAALTHFFGVINGPEDTPYSVLLCHTVISLSLSISLFPSLSCCEAS